MFGNMQQDQQMQQQAVQLYVDYLIWTEEELRSILFDANAQLQLYVWKFFKIPGGSLLTSDVSNLR